MPLDREEYVEQAYFFQTLRERMQQNMSTQDLLDAIRQEILATTMLPFAIEFMAGELRLTGGFATAMARLPHYFTPFQTYVVAGGREGRRPIRFPHRPGNPPARGRVPRRRGPRRRASSSTSSRPSAATAWATTAAWRPSPATRSTTRPGGSGSRTVRRQIGLVDFADMIYVRSGLYLQTRKKAEKPMLFGEKEGRIALANRRKDPLYLFSALQRHLGYPTVPRPGRRTRSATCCPRCRAASSGWKPG